MSAIIKNTMRVYTANQFLNLFGTVADDSWVTATLYSLGDVVSNSNKRYVASSSGTSGGAAPTHLSGEASDGGVNWIFVESDINNDFYDNNVYVGIGKTTAWRDLSSSPAWVDSNYYYEGFIVDSGGTYYICLVSHTGDGVGTNEPSVDPTNWEVITNETPVVPENSDIDDIQTLNESIFMKRIFEGDAKLAIENNEWVSGTIYSQYDDSVSDFNYPTPFYVLNSQAEKNIYKCIKNNNGVASTSEPTGKSISQFTTADGYIWQYMGSVSASDAVSFLTDEYIPISKKLADDGSAQWNLQASAKVGAVSVIDIPAGKGGTGYDTVPTVTAIPAAGETPTTPMTAIAVLSGTTIDRIEITNFGEGYVQPPLIKITPDAGDVAGVHEPTLTVEATGGVIDGVTIVGAGQYHDEITNVTINTAGGSGADLTPLLDENNVLIGFTVVDGGTGYVDGVDTITLTTVPSGAAHDYVTVVTNQPQTGHGSNILEELNAKNVIINSRLEEDEGGFLPTDIAFRRIMVLVDPSVADGSGVATAPKYKGLEHPSWVGTGSDEVAPGTGKILYLENIPAISRGTNQIEDLKIILKF